MQRINVKGRLLIRVRLADGSDDCLDTTCRADRLQPPFVDLFAPPLLTDGRMGRVGAEKRTNAGEAKAAFTIFADLPRPGSKQGVGHAVEILLRHEYYYFHLTAFGST